MMRIWKCCPGLLCAALVLLGAVDATQALTDLSGNYFDFAAANEPTPPADPANQYRLAGDTGFGWRLGTKSYNIDLNGFTLNQNTGGGNPHELSGALTGAAGTYSLVSGGSAGPAILSGSVANTFAGAYNISTGTNKLQLNKTAGIAAVSGTLNLASGTIQWLADHQVANTSAVTVAGGTVLDLNGHSETLGTLNITGGIVQLLLNSAGTVAFADSSALAWNGQLDIRGWNGAAAGGGGNQLIWGSSVAGLTAEQISRTFFKNPAGYAAGYYTAKALASGEIVPDATTSGPAVLWSGTVDNPMSTIGSGVQSRLTANGTFGWQTGNCNIPVDLNGYDFTVNNGGGNSTTLSGALTGTGNVTFVGRGDLTWEGSDNWLGGTAANTYSGVTLVRQGWLQLNKTAGATAIPGDLQIGNGTAPAGVKLLQDEQIANTARLTLYGGTLKANGHSETLNALTVIGSAYLDLAGGPSTLRFADSSSADWGLAKQLLIDHWAGATTSHVNFGNSAAGLTAGQIAKIGFTNPAGKAPGLYRANLAETGELLPNATAVEPVNPPFDLSAAAQSARTAVYTSNGRANLSGARTPLTAGAKVSFFGDSITWQNVYVSAIGAALASGAGTQGLGVQLFNRGINGGGVLQVRDGENSTNGYGGATPQPFAQTIASDGANVAVVFIGINDAWWRGTSPSAFEQGLRDIVAAADARGTKAVLASLTVHDEKPDGSNPDDPKIDQFARITRDVAASTNATLVDLRQVYLDYLRNNNYSLQLDGTLSFQQSGILTYDGVHPNSTGNALLADHIAQGIFVAAQPRATRVWNGGAGSLWNSPANWNGDAVPNSGDPLTFAAGAANRASANNMAAPPIPLTRVGLVTFAEGGFDISGDPLRLDEGISSTGDNIWGPDSILNAGQTFTSAVGMLTIGGAVNNNGRALTIAGDGSTTISGAISGAGRLIKDGGGMLTLEGGNTYSGGTAVNSGILQIAADDALPAGQMLTIGTGGTVVLASGLGATGADHSAAAAVPEPAALTLLVFGGLGLLASAWRRRGTWDMR